MVVRFRNIVRSYIIFVTAFFALVAKLWQSCNILGVCATSNLPHHKNHFLNNFSIHFKEFWIVVMYKFKPMSFKTIQQLSSEGEFGFNFCHQIMLNINRNMFSYRFGALFARNFTKLQADCFSIVLQLVLLFHCSWISVCYEKSIWAKSMYTTSLYLKYIYNIGKFQTSAETMTLIAPSLLYYWYRL